ncbi:hypothetical protein Tco_0879256 [Tanacetum coccineum]
MVSDLAEQIPCLATLEVALTVLASPKAPVDMATLLRASLQESNLSSQRHRTTSFVKVSRTTRHKSFVGATIVSSTISITIAIVEVVSHLSHDVRDDVLKLLSNDLCDIRRVVRLLCLNHVSDKT